MEPDIGELFRQYFPVIRAKCARILGDLREAEDVAQETFLRLCQASLKGEGVEARLAWVYRTSTHLAVDRWRRQRAGVEVALGEADAAGGSAPEEVVAARLALRRVVERLPADELEVGVLSRIDCLTHSEIAGVTGNSERTVRRMLDRLDQRLARLEAEGRA